MSRIVSGRASRRWSAICWRYGSRWQIESKNDSTVGVSIVKTSESSNGASSGPVECSNGATIRGSQMTAGVRDSAQAARRTDHAVAVAIAAAQVARLRPLAARAEEDDVPIDS